MEAVKTIAGQVVPHAGNIGGDLLCPTPYGVSPGELSPGRSEARQGDGHRIDDEAGSAWEGTTHLEES